MSISRIAGRYAKSLLDISRERKDLDIVKNDIDSFKNVLQNRDFYLMLKSPIINSSKKLSIFQALFSGKYGETTMAFFDIIIKKGREMYLPEIAAEFLHQYKILNKISEVTITTAEPLTNEALEDIKGKLLASDITMDKLDVTQKVDPSLLGGFILKIGDKQYDASVSHKLDQIKKELSLNQFSKSF